MIPATKSGGGDDRLAGMLPAELVPFFDDRFVGSCALFEEYVQRLALQVVRITGLDAAAREPETPGGIAARAGLEPGRAPVMVGWLLATLASRGWAARDGDGRYTIPAPLPDLDPREVAEAQERHDPSSLPSYRMADVAASLYPSVLRGVAGGEETMFAPERIGGWLEYFSNDNLIYAISNRIGAFAAERALHGDGGRVLELGGGLGSGAAAFLERFTETGANSGSLGVFEAKFLMRLMQANARMFDKFGA